MSGRIRRGDQMARPRVRWVVVGVSFVVAAAIGLGVIGVGPLTGVFHRPIPIASHGGVERLQLEPVPEGEVPPAFERSPAAEASISLALVASYIPDPLPAPLFQGPTCEFGGNLIVTLADGTTVTYGPCKRPASVERLRGAMLRVLHQAVSP